MNANAPRFNSDAIDSTIDRALSALRDAQPRSGSEMFAGRILASLEHRTTTRAMDPGGLPFHSFIVKGWGIARGIARGSARENGRRAAHLALWAAASAAMMAIASLVVLNHHPQENIRVAHPFANAKGWGRDTDARTKAAVPAQIATESPQTSIEPTHRMAHRSAMPVPCTQSGCPVHDDEAGMSGLATTPTDAQLLADLHAPSHPAPPLPLTPQERLFLRVLHYSNATQLAELDPMVRAKHDADETAAFKAFFPDPPPLQQPGDTE